MIEAKVVRIIDIYFNVVVPDGIRESEKSSIRPRILTWAIGRMSCHLLKWRRLEGVCLRRKTTFRNPSRDVKLAVSYMHLEFREV